MKSMEELLYLHPVFSLETSEEWFGKREGRAIHKRLQRLQAKGRVVRPLRSIYAAVPPGVEPSLFQPDPFLVLEALRPDCVFCGHSALDLQGVGHQVWNHVTAYSTAKAVTYQTKYATFSLIKSPTWLTTKAIATVDRKAVFLSVTCPELTLVEGFRYPARVGGIEELVMSADSFRTLDLRLLRNLIDVFEMRKLYAAIGWFLGRNSSRWNASEDYLDQLRSRRPTSPQYLERGSFGAVMDSKWNLLIPREVARQEVMDIEA